MRRHAGDWPELVATARLLVAALGEEGSVNWWHSQALTPVGGRMLERLFPRTVQAARLETASRSASIEHDARIGRIDAFHLFRLPTGDEAAVRDFLQSSTGRGCLDALSHNETTEERLATLARLAGNEPSAGGPGPVRCGTVIAFRGGRALARACATYLAGFRDHAAVYPYLEEVSA